MTTLTHSHKTWTDKGGHVTPAAGGQDPLQRRLHPLLIRHERIAERCSFLLGLCKFCIKLLAIG